MEQDRSRAKQLMHRKEVIFAIRILVIAVLIEVFVFNYRHWESISNQEITDYDFHLSEAFVKQEDGTYLVGEGDKYLEFGNINARMKTLFLDITLLDREEGYHEAVMLYQAAQDEGHEEYYGIPDREIWHSQKKSQYLTYHFYGMCKSLKITAALNEGEHVRIQCTLNPVIPMFFSWWRVGALWTIVMLFYLFRPSSKIYDIVFLEMKRGKSVALTAFLLGNMLLLYFISGLNPFFQQESVAHQREYQSLAEALGDGQFYLHEEPAASLIQMENPYDFAHRARVVEEAGEYFLWDHAYYEGKYYVYFGVVPAALFYLPYYILTGGEHLHNRQMILIGAFMLLVALAGLIYQIIKRWFPRTSLGVWLLLSELAVTGCGLVYMCKRTDMYTVPIITGLGFGFLGLLSFWCADREGKLSPPLVALGSFLTALVAGCRPQLFLVILFALIILRRYVFSIRYLKTKEGRVNMAAFAAPMIVVAALLMYYNYARFGSVFDFGANYNLNFNDMRYRGFVWDRVPLGIWAYLFATVKATLTFPFVEANYFSTNYLGITISEATYGGLFACNLFVWLCPLLLMFRKRIKGCAAKAMAYAGMIIGFIIIVVDTQMAGILMRYFSDFSIFFLLSALLIWLLFFERTPKGALRDGLLWFLVVCLLLSVFYQGLIFFSDTGEALRDLRKDLYAQIKYLVMFWL